MLTELGRKKWRIKMSLPDARKCPLCGSWDMALHVYGSPRKETIFCADCDYNDDMPLLRFLVKKVMDGKSVS